ncbi:MAG: hypothetical protein LBP22_02200 [Deltaproteobacteria bacterium]|nr:hypothetical protein [Deltaproteobacteria bacterium]
MGRVDGGGHCFCRGKTPGSLDTGVAEVRQKYREWMIGNATLSRGKPAEAVFNRMGISS